MINERPKRRLKLDRVRPELPASSSRFPLVELPGEPLGRRLRKRFLPWHQLMLVAHPGLLYEKVAHDGFAFKLRKTSDSLGLRELIHHFHDRAVHGRLEHRGRVSLVVRVRPD